MKLIFILLALLTLPSSSNENACTAELATLQRKFIDIDGPRLHADHLARKAQKKASEQKSSCDVHLSCNSCLSGGCAWCIGERACVVDEAWQCQGEEDHVGLKIGNHKTCPVVSDPEPVKGKGIEEEVQVRVRSLQCEW